jgi:hypothetical protein
MIRKRESRSLQRDVGRRKVFNELGRRLSRLNSLKVNFDAVAQPRHLRLGVAVRGTIQNHFVAFTHGLRGRHDGERRRSKVLGIARRRFDVQIGLAARSREILVRDVALISSAILCGRLVDLKRAGRQNEHPRVVEPQRHVVLQPVNFEVLLVDAHQGVTRHAAHVSRLPDIQVNLV